MNEMSLLLKGYRLTTAEIIYHLPDFPLLLQSFTWQNYDIAPDFPELHKFLMFWEKTLEGKMSSVHVTACELITPAECRLFSHAYGLH